MKERHVMLFVILSLAVISIMWDILFHTRGVGIHFCGANISMALFTEIILVFIMGIYFPSLLYLSYVLAYEFFVWGAVYPMAWLWISLLYVGVYFIGRRMSGRRRV